MAGNNERKAILTVTPPARKQVGKYVEDKGLSAICFVVIRADFPVIRNIGSSKFRPGKTRLPGRI